MLLIVNPRADPVSTFPGWIKHNLRLLLGVFYTPYSDQAECIAAVAGDIPECLSDP